MTSRLDQRSRNYEQETGYKSRERVAHEIAVPIALQSTNWDECHRRLAVEGIAIERTRYGANFVIDGKSVKASINRSTSYAKLKARFGGEDFTPSGYTVARAPSREMWPERSKRRNYYVAKRSHDARLKAIIARFRDGHRGRAALKVKLTQRTTSYEPTMVSDTERLKAALQSVADILKRHDAKTSAFDAEKANARNAVEAHYLLTIRDQVKEQSDSIAALEAEIHLLTNGGNGLPDKRSLADLSQSIIDKQAKVSNEHAGGADLTEHLKQFLGRTDLRFESGADGYRVLRRGKPAKRLSEGEKTAIAFLYFLVQLKDQDFDLAEGVVVIDDPISSLDASAIYQAFSFLKNSVQGVKQLFILTHNFEFLRLLINWVRNIPGPKTDKTYTMVLCTETADGRSARLAPLDKLLIDHATEYHYLFKVLYTFQSDGTILGCYHVPNIARKVLETFLDFHVPSSKSLYLKLEETDFDPHKKTAIYKFANDLSHHTGKGFDPALVAEAQKNTAYLLDMIKAVAPLHYTGLKKLSEA